MKKLLLTPLFALALAAQSEAACLTLTHHYSGVIAANDSATAYGPFTLTNGPNCRSLFIAAEAKAAGTGSGPKITIERQEGAGWRPVATAPGRYARYSATPGTYRIQHENKFSVSRVYIGNVTITK
jgi:hypothetical protein